MARKLIIAGNWKMHMTRDEAVALAEGVVTDTASTADRVDVVLIPPSPFLPAVGSAIDGTSVELGAQNMHPEPKGAFTGELSGSMLRSVGCRYVICGHSERRQIFGETSEWIGDKVNAAHRDGLTPILCIGETLDERESDRTEAVVDEQLREGIRGLTAEQMTETVLAYEPVWAIGTGKTASPEQAQAVHAHIRVRLAESFGDDVAQAVRIQYGGSVKPANAAQLLSQLDIDGALVGGASLDAASFTGIVNAMA